MKKTFAGLGVLALIAVGATGASFPANAVEVQPASEIVAVSDAIVASPDAVLTQSEPVVTTTAAEVPAEPVAVATEPVAEPVTLSEPVVVAEPVQPVAVVSEPVVEATEPVATTEPVVVEDVAVATDAVVSLHDLLREEGYANTGYTGYIVPVAVDAAEDALYHYVPSVIDPTQKHVYTHKVETPAE